MPLHTDDPRLTSFLLGELPAGEAASVARALEANPELRAALEELKETRQKLTEMLVPDQHALQPAQRAAIRRAAGQRDQRPWFMPFAAAAAIALAAILAFNHSSTGRHQVASNQPPATPARAEPAPPCAPTSPVVHVPPPAVVAAPIVAAPPGGSVALELPVQAGRESMKKIRAAIRGEHRLPAHTDVRIEEILNSFALTPAGLTAVARSQANRWHPDDRSSGATSHAATLATESLACPWQPSASLVLVTLRGNPFSNCDVKAVFRANPSNILRCRLLGFTPAPDQPATPPPTQLTAKSSTSMVLEIETATATPDLGTIEWSVNGEPAATVPITRRGDAEPSDDARFAALVCTFAQWLTGESPGVIDTALLAALARQSVSSTLPAERADFLLLIDQALQLPSTVAPRRENDETRESGR